LGVRCLADSHCERDISKLEKQNKSNHFRLKT
jgi:hypothetical protein